MRLDKNNQLNQQPYQKFINEQQVEPNMQTYTTSIPQKISRTQATQPSENRPYTEYSRGDGQQYQEYGYRNGNQRMYGNVAPPVNSNQQMRYGYRVVDDANSTLVAPDGYLQIVMRRYASSIKCICATNLVVNSIAFCMLFLMLPRVYNYPLWMVGTQLIVYMAPLFFISQGKATQSLYKKVIIISIISFVIYGLNLTILIILDQTLSTKYKGVVTYLVSIATFAFVSPRAIAFYFSVRRRRY